MDNDFINMYIDRLLKQIYDLTSRNVILETRLMYAEKLLSKSNESANEDIEVVNNEESFDK